LIYQPAIGIIDLGRASATSVGKAPGCLHPRRQLRATAASQRAVIV